MAAHAIAIQEVLYNLTIHAYNPFYSLHMASKKNTKDLSQLSDEELAKKAKAFRGIIGVGIGVMVAYVGFFLYLLITDKLAFSKHLPLLVVFFVLPSSFLPVYMGLKKVREEQGKRVMA